MILSGKFIMISVETRESNGKVYNNVNIEAEDGKLLRLSVNEDVVPKMQKYHLHNGFFDVGSFKGEMYMRLVDATPVVSPADSVPGKAAK